MRQVGNMMVVVAVCVRSFRFAYPVELIAEVCYSGFQGGKSPRRIIDFERHNLRGDRHLHIVDAFDFTSCAFNLGRAG